MTIEIKGEFTVVFSLYDMRETRIYEVRDFGEASDAVKEALRIDRAEYPNSPASGGTYTTLRGRHIIADTGDLK